MTDGAAADAATTTTRGRRGPAPPPEEEERDALFDAALALVERDGAERLTVAAVLTEAGLASRAFYRQFASKNDFLLALSDRETARSVERLRARVASAGPGLPAVEAWVDDRLDRIMDTGDDLGFELMWRNRGWLRAVDPGALRRVMAHQVEVVREAIADGVAAGLFTPDAEPELDAWTINAAVWAVAERHFGEGPVLRARAAAHLRRVVRGLLLPAGAAG